MPLFTVKLHRRRQQSCGRVDVRGRAPDGCGAGGNAPQPCFQSSICALAFSPDGSLLLAGGTSGGDEHTLCAFEWSTGTLVAKTVAIVARPLGLFRLLVGQLASKAEDDKAAPLAARRTGRAARALGIASGDGGGGGGAGGKAEAPMRLVVYGAASAPKFTTLSPPQGRLGRPAAPPPGQSAAAARVLARRACNLDARPLAPAKCSRGCSATRARRHLSAPC